MEHTSTDLKSRYGEKFCEAPFGLSICIKYNLAYSCFLQTYIFLNTLQNVLLLGIAFLASLRRKSQYKDSEESVRNYVNSVQIDCLLAFGRC